MNQHASAWINMNQLYMLAVALLKDSGCSGCEFPMSTEATEQEHTKGNYGQAGQVFSSTRTTDSLHLPPLSYCYLYSAGFGTVKDFLLLVVEACGSYWSKDVLAKSVVKDLRNRRSLTSSQAVAIVGMRKPLTNWKGHLTCPFLIRFVYMYIYIYMYIYVLCVYMYIHCIASRLLNIQPTSCGQRFLYILDIYIYSHIQ